jgi:hypothetical protein
VRASRAGCGTKTLRMRALTLPPTGAWLGEKNGSIRKMGWDKPTLVRWANAYALTLGCRAPPPLSRKTVGKMGLKGASAAHAVLSVALVCA